MSVMCMSHCVTPDLLVEKEFNRLGMSDSGQWKITECNVEFKWVHILTHMSHGWYPWRLSERALLEFTSAWTVLSPGNEVDTQ